MPRNPRRRAPATLVLFAMALLTWSPALADTGALVPSDALRSTVAGTVDPVACPVVHATLDAACERWAASYMGQRSGAGRKVAVLSGIAVVSGEEYTAVNGSDIRTVAYDILSGQPLWAARYDGPGHGTDNAFGLALSPDGLAVYVTGYSWGGSKYDYVTLGYRTLDGTTSWVARHVTGGGVRTNLVSSSAMSLAVSPDGSRVYVEGAKASGYVTVAYHASNGTLAWQATDALGYDARNILANPDGSLVYVTGYGYFGGYRTDAYDARTGALRWVAGWAGGYRPHPMAIDSKGTRLYVSGESYSAGVVRMGTVAYNASSGAQLWTALGGDVAGSMQATTVGVSPDDASVFVTGYSAAQPLGPPSTVSDIVTTAHRASDGSRRWERIYDGAGHGRDAPALYAQGILFSPCGERAYVGATVTTANGNSSIAVLSYNAANGTLASIGMHEAGRTGPYPIATGFAQSALTGDVVVVGGPSTVAFSTGLLHSIGPLPPPLAPQPCPTLQALAAA